MDIIYHRNCLDGVFSAHLFYMISKVIKQEDIDSLTKKLTQRSESKKEFECIQKTKQYETITDLTTEILSGNQNLHHEQKQLQSKVHQINEDFFHQPNNGISYWAYSMFAGEFIPLKFPTKNKILFILDTNLTSWENLFTIGQRYDVVVLIDHHTSFEPIKKDVLMNKGKMRKLFYVFSQNHCATQLCYLFLQKYLRFSEYFEQKHIENLSTMIKYISNFLFYQRLKRQKSQRNQVIKIFRSWILLLRSRVIPYQPFAQQENRYDKFGVSYGKGCKYLLKQKDLYKAHLEEIASEISHAMICRLEMSGKLKGKQFYILEPSNPKKISDIGVVLSYLSTSHGLENLSMLFIRNSDQYRISTRSHRSLPNPLALELAEKYQGGGHLCAAGFKLSFQKFKSQFTKIPCDKTKLKMTPQQVQKILLNQSLIEQIKE